jgi:hypothetical protein
VIISLKCRHLWLIQHVYCQVGHYLRFEVICIVTLNRKVSIPDVSIRQPFYLDILALWRWKGFVPSKRREPITLLVSVRAQKMWSPDIKGNKTSNLLRIFSCKLFVKLNLCLKRLKNAKYGARGYSAESFRCSEINKYVTTHACDISVSLSVVKVKLR